jgi:hypothetical protein
MGRKCSWFSFAKNVVYSKYGALGVPPKKWKEHRPQAIGLIFSDDGLLESLSSTLFGEWHQVSVSSTLKS